MTNQNSKTIILAMRYTFGWGEMYDIGIRGAFATKNLDINPYHSSLLPFDAGLLWEYHKSDILERNATITDGLIV